MQQQVVAMVGKIGALPAPCPVSVAGRHMQACRRLAGRLGTPKHLQQHAMWELVATAVAGLNAGAGLQAAIAGGASASDSLAFTKFASRSRMLGLFLSTVSTSACVMAYTGGEQARLAGAGAGCMAAEGSQARSSRRRRRRRRRQLPPVQEQSRQSRNLIHALACLVQSRGARSG